MEYRKDIDGLRGIAVLFVVLFHIQITAFSGGFIGVDIFFVISGFLVTRLIFNSVSDGHFRFSDFYARRIRRLFPALFATVIATLIAGFFLLSPLNYSDTAQSAIAALTSTSNFYFWLTSDYFDDNAHLKPLIHTWSLSVEEQFYLIWPASIVLLAKLPSPRKSIPIALASFGIASLILAELIMKQHPQASFFLLPFRIIEFAAGGILCFLPALRSQILNTLLATAGLAAIMAATLLYNGETPFPGLAALLPVTGTALLIYSARDTLIGKALSLPPFVYVGKISYSFYLAHWPIIVFYTFQKTGNTALNSTEQGMLFASSLICGALLYHLIETPFRLRNGHKAIAQKLSASGVGLWFTTGILLVTLGASFVWANGGLSSRYADRQETRKLLASMETSDVFDFDIWNRTAPETAPGILLIGDSHTKVLMPAFGHWAQNNGMRADAITVNGCAPILNVYTIPSPSECREIASALQTAAGKYDVVILAARWGLYTNKVRNGLKGIHLHRRSLHSKPNEKHYEDPEQSREVFISGLTKMVQTYEAAGTKLFFIGQVPPIGENPVPCISTRILASEVERDCLAADRNYVEDEIRWATSAAEEIDGLYVFDPTFIYCEDGRDRCRLTDNGKMIYLDDDHLAPHGAELLMRALFPKLEQMLEDK